MSLTGNALSLVRRRKIEKEVSERVLNGVTFLDETVPDWREKIEPISLNVADGNNCVLGQVFGNFGDGLIFLKKDANWAADHGMYAYGHNDGVSCLKEYQRLTEEWRIVLSA